jgi:hypothetical protein
MTANVRVIVSRYNEDLNWLNEYPFTEFEYIVYNKGINDDFCKNNVIQVVNLPNIGREGHSYLWHIIAHYDHLANILVFFPGSVNIPKKIEKAKRILNAIIQSNYTSAYFDGECVNSIYETFKEFTIKEHPLSCEQNCLLKSNKKLPLQLAKLRPYGIWHKHFFGNVPAHWYTHYGVFSVDKRDIIQHNVDFYEALIKTVSVENPEAGHYMERAWGAIFFPMNYTDKILASAL